MDGCTASIQSKVFVVNKLQNGLVKITETKKNKSFWVVTPARILKEVGEWLNGMSKGSMGRNMVFSAREKGFLMEAKIKTNNKGYFAALSVGRRHGSRSICIPTGRVGEGWKESGNLFCNITNEFTKISSSEPRETRETRKDLCYCLTDLLNVRVWWVNVKGIPKALWSKQTFEVLSYACGSASLENLVVIEGDQTFKLKLEISDPRNIPRIIPFVDGLKVRAAIVELDEEAINEDMAQFNGTNGGGSKAEAHKFSNAQVDELQATKLIDIGHRSPPSSVFEELMTKSGDGSGDLVENFLETAEKSHCSLTPGEGEIVDDRRDETGRDNRLPVRAVNEKSSKEKATGWQISSQNSNFEFRADKNLGQSAVKSDEAQAGLKENNNVRGAQSNSIIYGPDYGRPKSGLSLGKTKKHVEGKYSEFLGPKSFSHKIRKYRYGAYLGNSEIDLLDYI